MISDQIIYEDNHLLVLNKRAGQLVQGDKTGDTCLAEYIKEFLKQRDNKPGNVFCGVIHRLDRPVSGVCIFAKTSKALSRMNEMVKKHDFQKTYWAIAKAPENINSKQLSGEKIHLEDWLLRNEKQNKSFVVKLGTKNAKLASLDYTILAVSKGGYALIEVDLHTGRHHQIRCQLAHAGFPIKGDLKYGYPRSNPDASISLHARRVVFDHPVRHEEIVIEASPSQDFNKMFSEFLNL